MESLGTDAIREVTLTKGFVAIIDEADWPIVCGSSWSVTVRKSERHSLYAAACIRRKVVTMHRLLMNAPSGLQVDHINGDGLDNRRCNLRICTASQNLANTGSRSGRLKGVTWISRLQKWQAFIRKDGKGFYLGLHLTEEEAGRAYDDAAIRLFGEFARLNFPSEVPA